MKLISIIKKMRHKLYIAFYSMLPIQKNKIIMWANSFKQYGCSPKYITEYLLDNYPNKYDIVWVFEPHIEVPYGLQNKVRIVRYFSMEYLRELHTAKFVICNMRTGSAYYWKKRKGQVYIQTWHSSIRLKKIERDAQRCFDENYIESAKEDSKKIDLLLSGCDFSTQIFKNSFWYSGEIMKCGTPRCDIFFSDTQKEKAKEKVYKHYNMHQDLRVVIYAPTFRKSKSADIHEISPDSIIKALQARYGGQWVFMYRLHPNIIETYDFKMENAIDASKYPDMQELIAAADFMITDYSSCMFDMAIAGKKCILYAPDIDEYIKDERGLYFEISDLPFPLAKTNKELTERIQEFDEEKYQKAIDEFLNSIGSYERGNASEKVVKYIEEKINEG